MQLLRVLRPGPSRYGVSSAVQWRMNCGLQGLGKVQGQESKAAAKSGGSRLWHNMCACQGGTSRSICPQRLPGR